MNKASGCQVDIVADDGLASLQSLLSAIRQTPHAIYLLIDEYDNFANEVMVSPGRGANRYEELVRGQGTIKTLFKIVKGEAGRQGIDRVFLAGVSPVVLSDVTCGYNIAENLSLRPRFHDLCGFTEGELSAPGGGRGGTRSHRYPGGHRPWSHAGLLQRLLLFTAPGERLYNPTLALYFLKRLAEDGQYPEQLLDDNLAMDRNHIQYVARLPHGETVVNRALNPAEPLAVAELANRFGVQDYADRPARPRFPRLAAVLLRRPDPPDYPQLIRHRHTRHGRPPTRGQTL